MLWMAQVNGANADIKFNLTQGVTPLSHDIYNLHMTIFWICVVIGIVVFGTLFYAILHHRKSKGAQAGVFHEHLWLELTWTFIPLLILILLAIPATIVLMRMHDTEREDLTIKITGYQWKWRYEYLNQGINFFSNLATPIAQIQNQEPKNSQYLRVVDHPLVLPIHKKIRLLVTANDVIHSWWVPELGVKRDGIPGFINEYWTRINRPGVYYGQCTELCGIHHAYMPIVVIAMAEKDFEDWVTLQKTGALPVTPAAAGTTAIPAATQAAKSATPAKKFSLAEQMQQGEKVFMSTCSVCHQATGLGLPPTFPALKNSAIVKGPLDAHMNRVLNGKPGTAMQAFRDQLSDSDIAAVITYERNAWGNNTGTIVQPEDITNAKGKK